MILMIALCIGIGFDINDRSLHLFLSDANDQLTFMSNPKPKPAIYKLPECDKLHLGQYYPTDSTQLTVDSCPGQLLTI